MNVFLLNSNKKTRLNYFSTNRQSEIVDFREATIAGQAPDRGLYFPEAIPVLDKAFIEALGSLSPIEIAVTIIKPYTGNTIPADVLTTIVNETLSFPIPLVTITE